MRDEGKIGDNIAMIGVADQFGIELSTAARDGFNKAGFKLVYDKSYPIGTQDMQPILSEAQRGKRRRLHGVQLSARHLGAHRSGQGRSASIRRCSSVGVGTAFPMYKQRFGANVEGIMGSAAGTRTCPALQGLLQAPQGESSSREPDRWASPISYACLQMLQQAIERVGKIDRAAIIKELQDRHLRHRLRQGEARRQHAARTCWRIGQWQGGEFYGIGVAPQRHRRRHHRAQAGLEDSRWG